MAGPVKQFDQDEALNRALRLFWQQGYEATSMQDLVEAMGVNRASMYQTYGNKHDLFTASIERYMQNSIETIAQLEQQSGPALKILQQFFEDAISHHLHGKPQGCLINNTAVELGPHDALLAEKIRSTWQEFEAIFTRLIQRAIDEKEISADADAQQLARFLNVGLQGLMVKTKANTSQEQLYETTQTLFDLLQK